MFLSVFHRFKNVSLITKSIQTAMMLQTKFPRMVAGFDLVTVCTAGRLFVTGSGLRPAGLLRVQPNPL